MMIISLIATILLFLGIILLLRAVARTENPTFSVIIPGQMHALVTTESNRQTDITKGGGNIVDVVHSIPGKRLDRSSPDAMDWHYEDEKNEKKEQRGLLYHLFGLQIIGFFRYLRLNEVRTFRWGRKDEENVYRLMPKSMVTRYVFFSGQHDVEIKGVETRSILKLDFQLNIIYEETYPVKVRLRTADPYAVLTLMVMEIVINEISGVEAKDFLSNDEDKKKLVSEIEGIKGEVEDKIGISIIKVNLAHVDFDQETKRLLELQNKTEIENKAAVAVAEMEKTVQMLANDADADIVERVIKPAAQDERTVAVRVAEAYERNKVVTTFAPGAGNTMIPLK